ncbi:MAG: DUF393 domain-containing protein [Proteobacteria bacterium]|nr:DUF393 domain-containing protein [Pseudomonadota bacterium]
MTTFTNKTNVELGSSPLIEVFYDGACPICSREIRFIKKKTLQKKLDHFVWHDITDTNFKPENYGKSREDFMASLHVLDRGQFVIAMAAIRTIYTHLGCGAWMNWTAWPVVKPIVDLGYYLFSKFRPRFSCTSKCSVSSSSGLGQD